MHRPKCLCYLEFLLSCVPIESEISNQFTHRTRASCKRMAHSIFGLVITDVIT